MATFGERLKELREKAGLKQSDLAEKFKMGTAAFSKYELGHTEPRMLIIVELCKIFNVSTDYLLGISDEPTPYTPKRKDFSPSGFYNYFTDEEFLILNMIKKLPDNYKYEVKGYINGILSSLEKLDVKQEDLKQ